MKPDLPDHIRAEIRTRIISLLAVREPQLHRAAIEPVRKLTAELLQFLDIVEAQRRGLGHEQYDENEVIDTLQALADRQGRHGGLPIETIVEAVSDLHYWCQLNEEIKGSPGRPSMQVWKSQLVNQLADYWEEATGTAGAAYFKDSDEEYRPNNDFTRWVAFHMRTFDVTRLRLKEITVSELETILKRRQRDKSLRK